MLVVLQGSSWSNCLDNLLSLFRCHNETCLEESTIELICGFVWSSLIPAGLT